LYGLNYHVVPILVLEKIIASHILINKNYYEVADLELKLTLTKIAYQDALKPNYTQPAIEKYVIT
jgi:hypothetical protein